MALLVTIGNICILGNFQLGIWGNLLGTCTIYDKSSGHVRNANRTLP